MSIVALTRGLNFLFLFKTASKSTSGAWFSPSNRSWSNCFCRSQYWATSLSGSNYTRQVGSYCKSKFKY